MIQPASLLPFLFILFYLLFHCSVTAAQLPATPPAQPQGPQAPLDTVAILLKAGHFLAFVRLVKAVHLDTQLVSQLNSSTDGVTIFAPTDTAFSELRPGALDSLSDREKLELAQFHVLPKFLSTSDFQTLSNPVTTLAGSDLKFPLMITTSDSLVNVSSGATKTSISKTLYNDKQQVVIYQVDKVLLPKNLLPLLSPAPAPAPETSSVIDPDAVVRNNAATRKDHMPLGGAAAAAVAIASFFLYRR